MSSDTSMTVQANLAAKVPRSHSLQYKADSKCWWDLTLVYTHLF